MSKSCGEELAELEYRVTMEWTPFRPEDAVPHWTRDVPAVLDLAEQVANREGLNYAVTRLWPPETRGVWAASFFRGVEPGQGANGEGPSLGVAVCKALLALREWLREP
jgi:hypothetical protein